MNLIHTDKLVHKIPMCLTKKQIDINTLHICYVLFESQSLRLYLILHLNL